MKDTQLIMGMPVTVEIVDLVDISVLEKVFDFFHAVDEKFSTYKETSEMSLLNAGKLKRKDLSQQMQLILQLCEQTTYETNGYFDSEHDGRIDPSGVVKGWAIQKASEMVKKMGYMNFYIDAGGDIQVSGKNKEGKKWTVGIRNPFNREEIVKRLQINTEGVATSGNYVRGEHIWNGIKNHESGIKSERHPERSEGSRNLFAKNLTFVRDPSTMSQDDNTVISLTVIGPDVYEADRFATGAFAMGEKGIEFIERLPGFEGYMIDNKGIATMTSGLGKFIL